MVKLAGLILALAAVQASAHPVPGSIEVRWNGGAPDCTGSPQPPLQVHAYEHQTYILRQSPCAHYEANFLYLLVGTGHALLIDTGAVADPEQMPLAETVRGLLSGHGDPPLIVARTHRHRDHRMGDAQFTAFPSVRIAPTEIEDIQAFFGIERWPDDVATLDLGDRRVEVIPAPGHSPDHLLFYDTRTALLFSGDFLLPGRLMVDDPAVYRDSAMRIIRHLAQRPVTHILGGHIELDVQGNLYRRGSQHHPEERPLELSMEDLLALPAAFEDFNGFYARHPNYVLSNPVRNLAVLAVASGAVLALVAWGAWRFLRRRRRSA